MQIHDSQNLLFFFLLMGPVQPSFLFTDEEAEALFSILIFYVKALRENECSADSVVDFDCKPPEQHFVNFQKV